MLRAQDPVPYQSETLDWVKDHLDFVLPVSRKDGSMRWVGAIDCRVELNMTVDTLDLNVLKDEWPQWFGSNATTAGDKGKLAKGILEQWRFPDEFSRTQIHMTAARAPSRRHTGSHPRPA